MRLFVYCIVFTLIADTTVIGQVMYPNTFNHSYKSKFNLNYDSIKLISEFVLYTNDTTLTSNNFLNANNLIEFKPKSNVYFNNGLVAKIISFNLNKTDTTHYLYESSHLLATYRVSETGNLDDSIYFCYYPNFVIQQKRKDTMDYGRILEYDASHVLDKETIIKNNIPIAIIDYFFTDTLEITSFMFVYDSICFKEIISKEHENNLTFNEEKLNQYQCNGKGQVIFTRFIYNDLNNLTKKETFFNGELISTEKYHYFLKLGLIFAFEETFSKVNKITKFIIY